MGKDKTGRRGLGQWRWTEEQAREALEELAASGDSASAFARRKGIAPQRLSYWKRRLGSQAKPDFVAVALPRTSRGSIEIAVGGVVVRVSEDLDVEHVASLVEAIGRRTVGTC